MELNIHATCSTFRNTSTVFLYNRKMEQWKELEFLLLKRTTFTRAKSIRVTSPKTPGQPIWGFLSTVQQLDEPSLLFY